MAASPHLSDPQLLSRHYSLSRVHSSKARNGYEIVTWVTSCVILYIPLSTDGWNLTFNPSITNNNFYSLVIKISYSNA